MTARTVASFAGWFVLAAAPATVWLWVTGRWMPWWAALAVGARVWAVVEGAARVSAGRRRP